MTPELERYYEDRFLTMSTQGWADLMEEVSTFESQINDVARIETPERLHFVRGQLDMIRWLKNLKAISESTYEALKNESVG